jgi:Fe2+ or Zn2+ uptake regulation protein
MKKINKKLLKSNEKNEKWDEVKILLEAHHIQPSYPRLAVGLYCLFTEDHPTAENVLEALKDLKPAISRASVYNTLNLFVEKKLLNEIRLPDEEVVRFDPLITPHHHFYDLKTKKVHDIPWENFEIEAVKKLDKKFKVSDMQLLMRGTIN